ncbi:MAG: nucleotidyltransferase domain-containing protein [Acidobacteria bacterium]|nr:nucleotidyltransferase domain-containing protein [Acidobacteriota bacterium]
MCCNENGLPDDYDDDCYEFDIIDEQVYEFELYEIDVDDYWARAWSINDEGFCRSDCDVYNEREYRVFPTRYRLADFRFTKSLRRILNKNRDLKIAVREFRSTEGKDDLLTAHRRVRFQSEHERQTLRNSYKYLRYSNIELMEVSVFDAEKLIACSIFMVGERSVVSSIGFWDVSHAARGLGILTVLVEIKYAIDRGKEFYYLGDFIRQDPNYQYKTRFPALELFDWDNQAWVDWEKDKQRIAEMFDHRFRCRDDLDRDPEFTISLFETATSCHKDVLASALVGSRARGTAREDSDFDLVIVTENPDSFFNDDNWASRFHRFRESKIEITEHGRTLRSFYKNGDVYEFIIVPPSWADTNPVADATRRLVRDGMKILHDPDGRLEKLQKTVAVKQKDGKGR